MFTSLPIDKRSYSSLVQSHLLTSAETS